jgi:quercetin dioxygenase-like cupin family protein
MIAALQEIREIPMLVDGTLLAVSLAALALGSRPIARPAASQAQPAPVKRTMIGKLEVPGADYEVVIAEVEFAPGHRAGRHLHPGAVQARVINGEFMLALDGRPERRFSAGESFELPDGEIHIEGAVGEKPATLIAVYVVEKGRPLVQDLG